MKRGIKLLLAAGLTAGLTGAAFVDGGRAGGGRGPSLIERFDTDRDGKLTQAEINQARADRLAQFDSNGDGRLSLKEFEALWLDHMRERMVDSFQYLDNDGDGAVTGPEYLDPFASIVAYKDQNGETRIAPMILAQRIEWSPIDEAGRRGPPAAVIYGTITVLVVGAIVRGR